MTEDFKDRLENIKWRVNEADKDLTEIANAVNDENIDVNANRDLLLSKISDIYHIIGGIKFNVDEMLK